MEMQNELRTGEQRSQEGCRDAQAGMMRSEGSTGPALLDAREPEPTIDVKVVDPNEKQAAPANEFHAGHDGDPPVVIVEEDGCPVCGRNDGTLIDQFTYWSFCDAHRTRWDFAECYEIEPVVEHAERDRERLTYRVVKPVLEPCGQALEMLDELTRTLKRLGVLLTHKKALGRIAEIGNRVGGIELRAAVERADKMLHAQKEIILRCASIEQFFQDATGIEVDIPF
jgi:hypothetical protein